MVRVRKVLERYSTGLEGLIDMHTGNDFTYAGQKITDAVQYANHWAHVDSLCVPSKDIFIIHTQITPTRAPRWNSLCGIF